MLGNFFWAQWRSPVKGDWAISVRDDLNQLGFSDNLDELKSLSKFKIKAVVKEKVTKYAFNFLTNKLLTSSKLSKLRYCELELQDYFTHHKVK